METARPKLRQTIISGSHARILRAVETSYTL